MDLAELGNVEQQSNSTSSASGPSVYKYPGDGSLLMPEIPDEEEKSASSPSSSSQSLNTKKRSAADSTDQGEPEIVENKRSKK
jgi:hypothetical protein